MKKILLYLLMSFVFQTVTAQKKVTFGKVSKSELEATHHNLDSTASAAYLYRYRHTYFSSEPSGLMMKTVIHERIKIYKSEGFEYATHEIPLYISRTRSERVSGLKAYSYSLIEDKPVRTKLEKDQIYTENTTDRRTKKIFTMPNVDEGSVVEYKYTLSSPFFFNIDPIEVQTEIPVDYVYAKMKILEYLKFKIHQKGYYHFDIEETKENNAAFGTPDRVIVVSESDVPAIKDEPYLDYVNNYIASLNFEIAAYIIPQRSVYENYSTSWAKVIENYMKSDKIKYALKPRNYYLEDLGTDYNGLTDNQKMTMAMDFVRSNISWNGYYSKYPKDGIKRAYQLGEGNVADVNLTLLSVLRQMQVDAYPIVLPSKRQGAQFFATNQALDYVVVGVNSSKGFVFLDATESYTGINNLPRRAKNNGYGFVLTGEETYQQIEMSTSAPASRTVMMSYKVDEYGGLEGVMKKQRKDAFATSFRNSNAHLDEDELFDNYSSRFQSYEIINYEVSDLHETYKPVLETTEFAIESGVAFIDGNMYVRPLLFETLSRNPFVAEERVFPIDFGNKRSERYIIKVEFPQGYTMVSPPKNLMFSLPDNLGKINYKVVGQGNKLVVNVTMTMNSSIIPAIYYNELKDYYDFIIKQSNESIGFSKISEKEIGIE